MNRRNRPAEPSNATNESHPSAAQRYDSLSDDSIRHPSDLGPHMTEAQENAFANQTLLWLAVLPVLGVLVSQFVLDEAFEQYADFGCKDPDNEDMSALISGTSQYGVYISVLLLLTAFFIPKNVIKAPAASLLVYLMLIGACVAFAYYFNHAYMTGFTSQEIEKNAYLYRKEQAEGGKKLSEKELKAQDCLNVRSQVSWHVMYSFCAAGATILAQSALANLGFMTWRAIGGTIFFGLLATWMICANFASAFGLNTVVGVGVTLLPFLWVLRLQMWLSGRVNPGLKQNQSLQAAVLLVAEIPGTMLDAISN